MRLPKGSGKNFIDETRLPLPEQRKKLWLSEQDLSQSSMGFTEKLMHKMGMSPDDIYLLRNKVFGKNPIPDFNKPLPVEMLPNAYPDRRMGPLGPPQTGPDPFGLLKALLGRR